MSDTDRFHVLDPDEHHPGEDYDPTPARTRLAGRRPPLSLREPREAARFYRMDRDLAVAVNMAIAVGAPLLVTGEPGTGKTQVAWFLGRYFGTEVFSYQVRSNSTAEDLKYEFDAVGYLRTTRPGATEADAPRERFLHKRALWQAYEHHGQPAVVLIDEIDKAPRDFPNDLLLELDQHCFEHPLEPGKPIIPAAGPPMVVVTSNAERRLPDAFLRRCIVHHIELRPELLMNAVRAHFGGADGTLPDLAPGLAEAAVDRLLAIREETRLSRFPATAELLAWLVILAGLGLEAAAVRDVPPGRLPAVGALIKDHEDLDLLRRG